MNRWQKFTVAVIVALGFVPLCFVISARAKLFVEIENASGSAVTDVKVKFTGGTIGLPTLDKGDSARRKLQVQSESALAISYSDSKGRLHETNLDFYLEPSYRGIVRLKIDDNLHIQMINETRVY